MFTLLMLYQISLTVKPTSAILIRTNEYLLCSYFCFPTAHVDTVNLFCHVFTALLSKISDSSLIDDIPKMEIYQRFCEDSSFLLSKCSLKPNLLLHHMLVPMNGNSE